MKFRTTQTQAGITLIELLVALTIVGVLFSFALPAYQTNLDTTEEGVVRTNMHTIEIFQEDFFLQNGVYAVDLANVAAITGLTGWDPRDQNTYAIADSNGTLYDLTSTHPDGWSVCVRYPARITCP